MALSLKSCGHFIIFPSNIAHVHAVKLEKHHGHLVQRRRQGDASVVMATVATDCTGRARSIVQNAQRIDNSARFHDSLARSLVAQRNRSDRRTERLEWKKPLRNKLRSFFPGGTCCDDGRESDSASVLVGNIYEPHFAIWQQGERAAQTTAQGHSF